MQTNSIGRRYVDFTIPSWVTNAQCYVKDNRQNDPIGVGTWRTRTPNCAISPGGGGGPICGDGIINQTTEQCDLGSARNGKP